MANGWFDFVNGQTLPASRVQDYLMNQTVMVFDSTSARSSALTPTEGMITYLKDTNAIEFYSGTTWVAVAPIQTLPDPISPLLLIGA